MYSIGGTDGPVYFYADGNGYITKVWGNRLDAGGSPLVVTLDTPLQRDSVDFGELYRSLLAQLAAA